MRSEPLLILLLILSAPLNHAGRNPIVIWGVNRQGCRFSRPAPWMARGGGPPNHCRITGTPSLGEVPSGGARAFCLLLRFSKVRRRKGGTLSRRYRSNGYVLALIQHPGRLSGRHRGQVESSHRPSHIWIARHQSDSYRPPGRHGSKLPRHRFRATPKLCRYLCPDGGGSVKQMATDTPQSGASPLPH
ncbi:Threonine synthase [Pseudomonas sp. R4-39-08]|nr:Threonine synthase [Pseudomonas sp. R4-39-08]